MELRYEWLNSVRSMQLEMERLLDYFGNSKPPSVHFAKMWGPAIDIYETGTEVVILVELAGVKPDEIEIIMDGSNLVIRGERKEVALRSKKTYYQMEIHRGPFERRIQLPTTVDPDKTKASYEEGILEIILTKATQPQTLIVKNRIFGQL